jgi:hypothetical protein
MTGGDELQLCILSQHIVRLNNFWTTPINVYGLWILLCALVGSMSAAWSQEFISAYVWTVALNRFVELWPSCAGPTTTVHSIHRVRWARIVLGTITLYWRLQWWLGYRKKIRAFDSQSAEDTHPGMPPRHLVIVLLLTQLPNLAVAAK